MLNYIKIAGTSTSGIIAAALALGMSARTVEKLYTTHAKDITGF